MTKENNIRAIKFLNWYFLRIALDDLDFTKPLKWEGGGQGGGDVTKDMIITKSETMPDASSVSTGAVYMYMGETNETYTHGYIYQNIITTGGEHRWERMDVQPMGSSGGAVQISVNGRTTVDGYSVPNPTAEEMTAIYNAVVAGNNVQIVDSNNVYYQVILADSMDGAINIEILYFSEMSLVYTLENETVSITSKKIGGANYTAGNGISIDANNEISVADPVLVNNATAGSYRLAVGSRATAIQNTATALGDDAHANSNGSLAIGYGSTARGIYSIAIGGSTGAATAIQLGHGSNSDANTFKVANANGNFELMNANGNLPADRLASTTGLADGNYRLRLVMASGVPSLEWVAE